MHYSLLAALRDRRPEMCADYAREERWAQEIVPSLVVGDAGVPRDTDARARARASRRCRPASAAGGVVIVHGLGVHPDWGLIGGLRTGLADAGYVTLSVQMPVLAATATRDGLCPGAARRQRSESPPRWPIFGAKGVRKIAIVSHSLGASMANTFLAQPWRRRSMRGRRSAWPARSRRRRGSRCSTSSPRREIDIGQRVGARPNRDAARRTAARARS